MRLLDWWRGWSNADVESALKKIQNNQKGCEYMPLTNRETIALVETRIWYEQHQTEWGTQ